MNAQLKGVQRHKFGEVPVCAVALASSSASSFTYKVVRRLVMKAVARATGVTDSNDSRLLLRSHRNRDGPTWSCDS